MDTHGREKTIRGGFWAAALFYLLIAFEFFYMASPFAVYFYSVYRPGLAFINDYPQLSWLARFFLPHIVVETDSVLINLRNWLGMALFGGGAAGFIVGAGQVYYRKLTKKGAAVGGVYRYIRHPQYLSLAVCGLGLVILWPRYIVLVMYVFVLFAYWLLARLEEKECLARFGKPYEDYLRRTGMFLPFRAALTSRLPSLRASRITRAALTVCGLILIMAISLGAARVLERFSVNSLYAHYTADAAAVSLVRMDMGDLHMIMETALADPRVRERLAGETGPSTVYIYYVLPADWYMSELPMGPVGTGGEHHFLRSDTGGSLFRVVVTRAVLGEGRGDAHGADILMRASGTISLVEVLVNRDTSTVYGVEDPVSAGRYEKVPMPVF